MLKKFIVFEGVDGAGKSEIGKLVSAQLSAHFIESPLPVFGEIRKYIDQHSNPVGRFLFYMATNLDLSRVISEKIEFNDVICARYYYSTLIGYASRTGKNVSEVSNMIPVTHDSFYQPNLTIFLDVNKQEQVKRINTRNKGKNSGTDYLCLNDEHYSKTLADNYRSIAKQLNWNTIDTSNLTIEEVAEKCIRIIEDTLN